MEIKKYLKFPAILLPGGTLILAAIIAWEKWGPGAVVTDQNEIPIDFTSDATRELRARNPLGVSLSGKFDWDNMDLTYPGRANENDPNDVPQPGVDNLLGDHLVVFKTAQDGLNAAAWLLHDNYFGEGLSTPYDIGNKWAGDSEDKHPGDTYGHSIAQIMHLDDDAQIQYGTDGVNLMQAQARMENGTLFVKAIPVIMYQRAITYGESE